MNNKTLNQYQQEIKKITEEFGLDWPVYVRYIHLVEEIGELGEALTVQQGDRKAGSGTSALADHSDVSEEIGDVIFSVLDLSSRLNINLDTIIEKTLKRHKQKLSAFKKKGNLQGRI